MVLLKNLHEVAALIAPTLLQLQESLSVFLRESLAAPDQQLWDQLVAEQTAALSAVSQLQAQTVTQRHHKRHAEHGARLARV